MQNGTPRYCALFLISDEVRGVFPSPCSYPGPRSPKRGFLWEENAIPMDKVGPRHYASGRYESVTW
jgi:hypothetical protein